MKTFLCAATGAFVGAIAGHIVIIVSAMVVSETVSDLSDKVTTELYKGSNEDDANKS